MDLRDFITFGTYELHKAANESVKLTS